MRRDADTKQKRGSATAGANGLVEEAALLRVLSDPTRLRLAVALSRNGETCVCTLAEALAEPEYKISRHLAVMRSAGLVVTRRAGTWMYYKLASPGSSFEKCLWRCFHKDLGQQEPIASILRRMKKMNCEERKR